MFCYIIVQHKDEGQVERHTTRLELNLCRTKSKKQEEPSI